MVEAERREKENKSQAYQHRSTTIFTTCLPALHPPSSDRPDSVPPPSIPTTASPQPFPPPRIGPSPSPLLSLTVVQACILGQPVQP
ncbi:pre-mRNA 3'-end-processing factor FIP1-like [Larimichthys crocea]|uniref:pre-mRNA 3'-end-processing factor FIP1-like n=1 Tax=Larimichthys crocea TaxID=215358 RepID=UPI000F5E1D65|nr:pre-mRNA 3'-end-processing factor FIP1-like [Larimichthys crocea]